MKKLSTTLGVASLLCLPLSLHAETKFTGFIEAEGHLYPSEGLLAGQKSALASIAIQPEVSWKSESEAESIRFKTFARLSNTDGHRDHADIRELYYNHAGTGWQVEAGINKVYWGVVESLHLVDIVNQTDNVESITGEEKLGQPMVSLGIEQGFGNIDMYVLPYFRERSFPTGPERFQLSLNNQTLKIDEDKSLYQSEQEEKHVDYAIRWANNFGNLDIALSYFNGTNRDPLPIIVDIDITSSPPKPKAFGSYYEQLVQGGLELQYLYDDWAFKLEASNKHLDTGNYTSVVTGFEYTISDIDPWGADLGLLAEYLWNNRSAVSILPASLKALGPTFATALSLASATDRAAIAQQATRQGNYLSPFENDIFIGARFSLNDINSSQFLAGAIIDADDQSTSASFEGSTRIGDSIRISLNVYAFTHISEKSAFYSLRKDDQVEIKAAWYF